LPQERTPLGPRPTTPATVPTERALRDEAAALERVDALAGGPTVEHDPGERTPVDGGVPARLEEEARALDRVDGLYDESLRATSLPALVEVTLPLPEDLVARIRVEAGRRGVPVAELHVAALERLLAGVTEPAGTPIG